ncbi:hypothetical protein EJB05_33312, partial [Eragrostis curvula]
MRFPILKVATRYPMETQVKIPAVAVVLHNIIRSHNGDEEWLNNQETLINPRKFVALPIDNESYRDDVVPLSNQRNEGNAMRDEIAKRMWADYERTRRRRGKRRTANIMSQQRARWTSRYEKGLVDILNEYRLSHYRGQNGWSSEGWNKIAKDFNRHFPEAKFTKGQIQDKEAQLKKDYKAIKSIRKRSGVNWNSDAAMINTTSDVWEEIIQDDSKLARYEKKSFPLFEQLDLLYEEGKHCFTSSRPQNLRSKSFDSGIKDKVRLDFTKKRPWRNVAIEVGGHPDDESLYSPTRDTEYQREGWESESVQLQDKDNRRSQQRNSCGDNGLDTERAQDDRQRTASRGKCLDTDQTQYDRQRTASGVNGLDTDHDQFGYADPICDSDKDDDDLQQSDDSRSVAVGPRKVRSRKGDASKPVPRIEETMSEFMALKREQASAKKRSKMAEDKYSMTRCLEVLRDTGDVSDEIRILASDVFKDALNREIFLGYEPRLRGLWLKKEVNKLST